MTNVVDPYASTVYLPPAAPSRPPARPDAAPSRDYIAAIVIAAAALLLRLYVAYQFASEPIWDGHYYHFGAARLAHGLGYSEDVFRDNHWVWKPWTHYPVGYSFFLSLFYRVFGAHVWVAVVANAVVGALTVFAIHRLAYRFLGKVRARIAASLAALHPGLVLYTAVVMSEPLAAALLVCSAWAVASAKPRVVGLVVGGFLLGASVLVRPSSLLALPLMVFFTSGDIKKRIVETSVVCVFCFAAILPWTYRNCRKMDGCALVSTNAGWNLAIGALTETGRFRPLRATDGCPVVTGQVQQDRCFRDRGIQVILSDPMRWLSLAPAKLAQTFNHESFAVEYLRESNPALWPEARRVAFREKLTFSHRLVFWLSGLSVIGLGISRQTIKSKGFYLQLSLLVGYLVLGKWLFDTDAHPFFWLSIAVPLVALVPLPGRPRVAHVVGFSLGFLALTALTHVVFFGDDRYHLVVTPLLCLLTAAALRQPEPEPEPQPASR